MAVPGPGHARASRADQQRYQATSDSATAVSGPGAWGRMKRVARKLMIVSKDRLDILLGDRNAKDQ